MDAISTPLNGKYTMYHVLEMALLTSSYDVSFPATVSSPYTPKTSVVDKESQDSSVALEGLR